MERGENRIGAIDVRRPDEVTTNGDHLAMCDFGRESVQSVPIKLILFSRKKRTERFGRHFDADRITHV